MPRGNAKPKRTFADIEAKRKRYNPEVEGYGSPKQWTHNFYERMGWEEAQKVIYGQDKTPRQILGVGLNASWVEIQASYRKLVMEWHPDRVSITGKVLAEAEEMLKKINAAYSVLAHEMGK